MSKSLQLQLIDSEKITDPLSSKGKLLVAAAKLFRQKGYEKTTVRDLAAALGIQSGSLFYHYKSKEAILKAVMQDTIVYTTEKLIQALQPFTKPRERLLALITAELDSINGDTEEAMAVLVFEWQALSPESQAELLTLRQNYENLWLQTLQQAKDDGIITTEPALTRRLLVGSLSWSRHWYDPQGDMTISQLAEQVVNLITS